MTFLEQNIQYITTRVTNNGRKALSRGDFNIKYFQIGDSEYDYSKSDNTNQRVTVPFDYSSGIKTPYKLDNTNDINYGVPICKSTTIKVLDKMGSSGFITEYSEYIDCDNTPRVLTYNETFDLSSLDGSNMLEVSDPSKFNVGDFVTLIFDELCVGNGILNTTKNSLVYKIISVDSNGFIIDRNLPDLRMSGIGYIILNRYLVNAPSSLQSQKDSWVTNVVWSNDIIGTQSSFNTNSSIVSTINNNKYLSTKNLLGYTSSEGQTFTDLGGAELNGFSSNSIASSFFDCFGQKYEVSPEEQREICILTPKVNNPTNTNDVRMFMYDDYIGDNVDEFSIYIPFILYHRSEVDTIGAYFRMDGDDNYVNSNFNETSRIRFRYLIDEKGYKVGKIFMEKQMVVFDDQEIVAAMDYRSNRRYTLPAPKVTLVGGSHSDTLFTGNGKQTFYVTYMTGNRKQSFNGLPCNYYMKIVSNNDEDNCNINTRNNISLEFNQDEFLHLSTNEEDISTNFSFDKLYILLQETDGSLPKADSWKIIDVTTELGVIGNISKNTISFKNIIINKTKFDNSPIYQITNFMGVTYGIQNLDGIKPRFGEEQDFAGSVKLERGSDIEEMIYHVNLPSSQFNITQNPTYVSGQKYLTEVTLLDKNREPLIEGKFPTPLKRVGNQVLGVKLDF